MQLHETYAARGLKILALSGQDAATLRPFVEQNHINYAVGVGSSSSGAYGVSGIPHTFLIGTDGRIVSEGHSMPSNAQIEELLAQVRRFPERDYPRAFRPILQNMQAREYGDAWRSLRRMLDSERTDEADREHAQALADYIDGRVQDKVREMNAAEAAQDWFAAWTHARELAAGYEGHPAADEAEQKIRTWERDREISPHIDAGRLVETGRELERQQNWQGAFQAYQRAARAAPGSRHAEAAEQHARALREAGRIRG